MRFETALSPVMPDLYLFDRQRQEEKRARRDRRKNPAFPNKKRKTFAPQKQAKQYCYVGGEEQVACFLWSSHGTKAREGQTEERKMDDEGVAGKTTQDKTRI